MNILASTSLVAIASALAAKFPRLRPGDRFTVNGHEGEFIARTVTWNKIQASRVS